MKTLLILLITIGNVCLLSAQNFELADKPVSNITNTQLSIDDTVFSVSFTPNGNYYLKRTSANSGKEYKQYLGYITEYKFKGNIVFTNKERTEYWYLGLTKTRFPKKIALKAL